MSLILLSGPRILDECVFSSNLSIELLILISLNSIHFGDFRGAAALIGASVSASLASVYTGPLVREAPVVGIAVDEVVSNNRSLFL